MLMGDLAAILPEVMPANVAVAIPWTIAIIIIVLTIDDNHSAVRLPVAMPDPSVVPRKVVLPHTGMAVDLNPDDEIA
jgi:hypothetical protein